VDTAVGLHYWSLQPTGTVGATAGPVMASVDTFDLVIHGVGGHAAIPHEARDALVAAAYVVTSLQTVVSRETDPLQPAVVTVGELHAGTVFNVIPGEARLAGTVRTFDRDLWQAIPDRIERIVRGVCEAHGCTYELDYRRLDGPTINDAGVAALVREVGADLVGSDRVVDNRTMGGEDMSEFLERVPGCFFFVGARNEEKGITAAHHHPAFDLDEDALVIGAEMLVRVARRILSP
jgi:amidohydrolase